MKTFKLYSPAIVLLIWAIFAAMGAGLNAVALFVMAVAVFVHIRTEVHRDPT